MKTLNFIPFCLFLKWLIILFIGFNPYPAFAQVEWENLSPGVKYKAFQHKATPWSVIHVFKIDLYFNKLCLSSARDKHLKQAFVKDLVTENDVIAVNGGFFDVLYRPLGLRINNFKTLNLLKPISWWGVFYIENNHAKIVKMSKFNPSKDIKFAIQSGPRLIFNGHIPVLRPGRDERTALGINAQGEVLLLVTENAPLTTQELAKFMQKAPIYATDAINLDGGSSTQVYTNFKNLNLDIHGFSMVTDAVIIKKR